MKSCQYIVILHGWQSSKEKWNKVKEIIEEKGVKVIIPDLPGFKPETKLDYPWNLSDYLDWIENFIEEKKNLGDLIEPFFLLGHSFGGRVSIKLALNHPEKLRGLILVSSAGIRNKKMLASKLILLNKLSFLPGYLLLRKAFYKFVIRRTDYLRVEGVMKETFKKIIKEDLSVFLSKIKVKTLILWGKKDKVTPVSNAYLMKKKIEGSELKILENIGHTPYLEDPKTLANEILTFIQ